MEILLWVEGNHGFDRLFVIRWMLMFSGFGAFER